MKKTISGALLLVSLAIAPQLLWSQNVGVGLKATRAKLELNGAPAGSATSAIFGGDGAGISLQRNWPAVGFNQYYASEGKFMSNGYAAVQFLDPASGSMFIDMYPAAGLANANTGTGQRAISILNNGNMGIRDNPVNATLYVHRKSNSSGSAAFGGTEYNSHFHYGLTEDTYIRAGKLGSNVYVNDIPASKIIIGAPTVGINEGNPTSALHIRQTGGTGILLVEPAESFNNWEMVVEPYGNGAESSLNFRYLSGLKGYFKPDGNHTAISDRRLKQNIKPLPPLLDKLLQLRPVSFYMKYHPDQQRMIGLLAQEVKTIFPELVEIDSLRVNESVSLPDFHSLKTNDLKILVVKGIQEEQPMIEQIREQQADMLRRLQAVEKRLARKN